MQTADIAWLAGIWDGEGSILFQQNGNNLRPSAEVSNTDVLIANKVIKLLEENDIGAYIRERSPKDHRKSYWQITVGEFNSLQKFLELVVPYMNSSKKHRGELVLHYLNKRFERANGKNLKQIPYSDEDRETFEAFRSSTTTRETL